MARLLMQQALSREWLDELFEQYRDKQYTPCNLFQGLTRSYTHHFQGRADDTT